MNKVFELEPGEKIFWQAEVDKDVLETDREFVKQTELKAYYVFPFVALFIILGAIWLGGRELNLTTILASIGFIILTMIFGMLHLKKQAKEKTLHNPYFKDVAKFILTQYRFLYLDKDDAIIEEFTAVDELKLRDHRKRRSYTGPYVKGLAFYYGRRYFWPEIFIWGLKDFDKTKIEVVTALKSILAIQSKSK